MVRFSRLQTKLNVLYGALFGVLLSVLGAATYTAIASNVQHTIEGELAANGAVFDRVWALRSRQLQDSAQLLARDFGFRAAVATDDQATAQSAVDNLRTRLGLDIAFIVDLDGDVIGADPGQLDSGIEALWAALDSADGGAANGVLMIGGQPYQAISAPIQAPALVGWVVFAARLDRKELASLEQLSSAELRGALLTRRGAGDWATHGADRLERADLAVLSRFASTAIATKPAAERLRFADGAAVALVQPLKTMDPGEEAALVLRYPLAAAMAPYQPMLATVAAIGMLSLVALLIGSGLLARGVTRPIAALDEAARRLARGEEAHVEVVSADEIGGLAQSFNTMAAEIGERERRITHQALHDSETDLPNRLALISRLDPLIAEEGDHVVVVAALGLERFALVRSAIGYGLIGLLWKELGRRIGDSRPDLQPARLSTSTLAVAFRAASLDAAQVEIAELVRTIERPVRLGAATADVGVSAGLAVLGLHGDDAASLIERANVALDQAHAAHRKLCVFDEAAYGDPAANLDLMSQMIDAVAAGDLALHYQPKLDLRTGKIAGLEALVRWRHAERGMLSPDLFVGMAEETGHIRALTDWVLDRAIQDQAALRDSGHGLRISVNVSGRLVGDRSFAADAIRRIQAAGADICFEITETAVIDNPDDALELIEAYHAAQVPISIDDYGSGLSSLAYLKQIAAQELKIDKAFVLTLAEGRREALIVKSTVDLAHALGLKVVAEGVETAACLALLQTMGCDVAQGYYVARPLPLAGLQTFLAEHEAGQTQSATQQDGPGRRTAGA